MRESVYVPVRDGTRLAVNIYRPANEDQVAEESLPVIFVFTPYRARYYDGEGQVREAALQDSLALRSLIRAGYIVAVADVRGKGASFGSRFGFQSRQEALDGHDLVEWLAARPYSSGSVGMVGCSYLGGTTMHTASTAPPSLKAIFTGATDWDKYDFVRRGGITAQFNTRPDEPLSDDLASVPMDADGDGTLLREAVSQHADNTPMAGLWYSMPYRDSVSPYTNSAFWQEAGVWRYADAIRDAGIATYMWSNWNDEPTSAMIVSAANLGSRLLVGPGTHCETPKNFDFTGEIVRYFDFHLKGADNGFDEQPRVTYWEHEQGTDGRYVQAENLPGAESETLTYYFAGREDRSDTLRGGTLVTRPGSSGETTFAVDYDVANDAYFAFWPEPLDEHGLVYDTAPLTAPMELLGFPVAHVTIKVDRPDADVFVYLEEVNAAGDSEVLSFGRLKASNRAVSTPPWNNLHLPWHSGFEADAAPIPEGETVELPIPMLATTRTIPAGSRLRFVVTGADPRQRNLADLRQDPAPRITVLHGWEASSRIDLPVKAHAPSDRGTEAVAAAEGQIGEPSGTGPYPAVAQAREDAPGYTIYRPALLPDRPLPVVLWGNGGCRDNGLSASRALREFASHGFLVIANGAPREESPLQTEWPDLEAEAAAPRSGGSPIPDQTSVEQYLAAIDWAEKAARDPSDPLFAAIDASKVAALGHSCGGLQAISAGADPRISTVLAFGSGVYNRPGTGLSGVPVTKADLAKLHTPIGYIVGGPADMAYPNASDDFEQIDHLPVLLAELPVGHGGTLAMSNGGDWARVGSNWLRWTLFGDQSAGREFIGDDCGLCASYGWSIKRKNFPE
ncbi:CocE/NonD family hydrolase [Aurantiacibacter flavus]|uniref:CocE/NonD family hydrolase n=1 Tax=Aurantiacibacter flavus TaxID=3145232 RepID=UPI003216979E